MKTTLTLLLFALAISAFAQPTASVKKSEPAVITSSGTAVKPTEKKGIAIAPSLQADIKQLDAAMKPYEDLVKEYNRLAGLKNHIYDVLIKANGIDMKKLLTEQTQITVDSIKLVVNK